MSDGAVLVVRCGETSKALVRQSLQQLDRVGCPVLGTVLNRAEIRSGAYKKYYGRYGKKYGAYYGAVAGGLLDKSIPQRINTRKKQFADKREPPYAE